MLTRALTRVARMNATELWFRTQEHARTVAEGFTHSSRSRRWRQERLRSLLLPTSRELLEAKRALVRQDVRSAATSLRTHFLHRAPRFPIDPQSRHSVTAAILDQYPEAAQEAARRGDRLLEGYRDLLGYRDLHVGSGSEIDWHFDAVHKVGAPLNFWSRVPYLDPRYGDHKIIWELNRHQHWLALGRAAWLTGDRRYADGFRAELASWLAANPPLTGINWSSMLELGFRAISWLWGTHFFIAFEDDSDGTWLVDLLVSLDRQLNHISRHLSRYFSPNTHLLGEGLALYIAGRVLPELTRAASWADTGREILRAERKRQVNSDGGHAELSAHYHRYALDFYLFALVIARRTNDACASEFAEVTSRLATFCRAIVGDNGFLPTIGDDDGGMLFPICGRAPADVRDSLSLAAVLLDRPDLAMGAPPEETLWMLGGDASRPKGRDMTRSVPSRLFPDTGYAVLRSPDAQTIFDIGQHGFLNGGHAHADALSIVMSIQGKPFLVDPGTCTYTINTERRNLFRSTAMHNTVTVDDRSQSIPDSPFHWKSAANATIRLWTSGQHFDAVEAEHDGYLPDMHRRVVVRDGSGLWLIADHVIGDGDHKMDIRWHLDRAWRLTQMADNVVSVEHWDGIVARIASTGARTQIERGELSWRAPVYGQHLPALTATVSHSGRAPLSVVSVIVAGAAPETATLSIQPVDVTLDNVDHHHRIGVVGTLDGGSLVALFATDTRVSNQPRAVQRMEACGNEFHTDAQIAVLRLSATSEPTSLTLIGATRAGWNGPQPFEFGPCTSAADLHLNRWALLRLIRSAQQTRSQTDSMERITCAE
ncbi:MAG TPA: alginate lyase family protein [Vicinamibacterales bacterium]|nr:alginate lyase family protein [Vicinamibacterales bacterium]